MLAQTVISAPAIASLVWAAVLSLTAFRIRSFRQALSLLLVLGIYFLAKNHVDSGAGTYLDAALIVREVAGACIAPLTVLLMLRLRPGARYRFLQAAWIAIPVTLLTGGLILSGIAGPGKTADTGLISLHDFWLHDLYRILIYVSAVFMTVYLLVRTVKEHEKGVIRPALTIGRLITLLFWMLLFLNGVWEAAAAFPIIVFTGYLMLFGTEHGLSWKELGAVMKYNVKEEVEQEPAAQAPAVQAADTVEETPEPPQEIQEESLASAVLQSVSSSWDDSRLLSRFQHLMLEEQIFLQPKLTLADVADMLKSNKTYVSKMVNDSYKVGFPELINTLRVDYAEQYILSHRDAKQDEIARECGFISASSFNNTFKNVTGMPPKQWVAGWDARHKS